MYVSQLLSEYIKTKKINIKKCAEYFQIDRSTLYKIIRGERKIQIVILSSRSVSISILLMMKRKNY